MEEKEGLHKPSSSPPPPPPMGEVEEGSVFMSSGDHGTLIMVPWVWRRSRSRSPKAYGPNCSCSFAVGIMLLNPKLFSLSIQKKKLSDLPNNFLFPLTAQ